MKRIINILHDRKYTITFNDGSVKQHTMGSMLLRYMAEPTRASTVKSIKMERKSK